MTFKQFFLQKVYPVFNWINKRTGNNTGMYFGRGSKPHISFYALQVELMDGQQFQFSTLKNKKVLIVNTASDCGYTAQFEGLQQLHEKYKDSLTLIGFPANDFKEQEKANDTAIADFCKKNYGVEFLLAKKSIVIKSRDQHPVFSWLSHADKNGWNDRAPVWNFCKYLVNESGVLIGMFESAVEPMSKEVVGAVEGS